MTVMKQMKLFLALAVAWMAGANVVLADESTTFTAITNGVEVTYMVKATEPSKVVVGDYTNPAISTEYIGEVTIPATVSRVVGDVTYTYTVAELSWHAFNGCKGLTGVHLPSAIHKIPRFAFSNCDNMSDAAVNSLLQQVDTIEQRAFTNCMGLEELDIPEGVVFIGTAAFEGSARMRSVVLPSTLTYIAGASSEGDRFSRPFYNCTSLTKATIKCAILMRDVYQTNNGDHPVWRTFGDQIRDYVIGEPIERIGTHAFRRCANVNSIELPRTLRSIGDGAMDEICKKFEYIKVDLVTWCKIVYEENMYDYPFLSGISSFVDATTGQDIIEHVVIPEGTTTINPYAFWNFNQMRELTIASTVTSIGKEAFALWDPARIAAMGQEILWQKVTCLATTPPELGENAFANVPEDVVLFVPTGSLEAYENSAWAQYFKVISETVMPGNTFASNGVVYKFVDVTERTIEVAGYVGDATELTIPSSVDFANLVYTVKSIGDEAFKNNTTLTEISLPESIEAIGSNAFTGCTNLKTYYCDAQTPPTLGANAFDASVATQSSIYVPSASVYMATAWADYFSFVRYATIDGYRVPVITLDETTVQLGTGTGNLFANPSQVTSFTIPDYVFLSDGKQAKRYAVSQLGDKAFVGCTNMTSLYLRRYRPIDIDYYNVNVFDASMQQNCTLYIRSDGNSPYGWGDFFASFATFDPSISVDVNGVSVPFVIVAEDSDPLIGNIAQFGRGYDGFPTSGGDPKKARSTGWRATPSEDTFVIPEEIEYGGKTYTVKVIGKTAFCNATYSIVDFPKTIAYIDGIAFGAYNDRGIITTLISHCSTPPVIQDDPFYGIIRTGDSSCELYIPLGQTEAYDAWGFENVKEIGGEDWVFTDEATGYTYQVLDASDGNYTVWMYGNYDRDTGEGTPAIPTDYEGSLTVPETVEFEGTTYTVIALSDFAFNGCAGLTDVTIPNTIEYIGYNAFFDCTALTSVTCLNPEPAYLEGGMVGYQQPNQSCIVYVPTGCVPSDYEAWSDCFTKFREIGADCGVGDTFTEENEDGDEISYMVTGLSPNTVQTYRNYYDEYRYLEEWDDYGYFSVYEPAIPTDKESITIPRRVTHEGKTYTVTAIGPASFYGCDALKSVSIPEGVTQIDADAVSGATNLKSLTLPRTLTRIDYAAFEESSLTTVRLPASVREIGAYAFSGSSELKSITIGSGTREIRGRAFEDCNALESVYFHVPADSIMALNVSDYAFTNAASDTRKLYVPAGAVEAYTATDWTTQGGFGGGIEEMETKDVRISNAGMATYTSLDKPLDFSNVEGMKAYYVSDFDATTRNLELTRLDEAPVGVGMVFKAEDEVPEEGITFQVPVVDYANGPEQNMLVAITQTMDLPSTETIDGVDYTNFVLTRYKEPTEGEQTEGGEESSEDEGVVGFYRFSETQLNYPAGKAYLHIPTSLVNDANGLNGSTVKGFVLNFGDAANEPGNIATILERLVQIGVLPTGKGIYNLSGQRVSKAQKGLYIVNGKKVVIK